MNNEYGWIYVVTINDTIETEWESVVHFFKPYGKKSEEISFQVDNGRKGRYGKIKNSNGILRAKVKMNPQNEGLLSEMRLSNTEPLICKIINDGTVFKGFFTKFKEISEYNIAIDLEDLERGDGKQGYYKYWVEFRLLGTADN